MNPSRRLTLFVAVVLSALFLGTPAVSPVALAAPAASTSLSNLEFWKMVTDFSEPDGTFRSDNLLSNETDYPLIMPPLVQLAKPGRAYVGVGPEQNFNYIAVLKPDIACIVDIRRGNLDLQLMYKALFELSSNRVDFVSRLFSRPADAKLTTNSTVTEIFTACARATSDQTLFTQNLQAIDDQLAKVHGFGLSSNDFNGIEFVLQNMFSNGPDIHYEQNGQLGRGNYPTNQMFGRRGRGNFPTYTTVMEAADAEGRQWSYLADESAFAFVKDFESRNLIVPVIGNFGGPKALRAVASYLKQKNEIVAAFYVSNVEQYLITDHIETDFLASAATLPTDSSSVFIRSSRPLGILGPGMGGRGFGPRLTLHLDPMTTNAVDHAPAP